MRRPVFLAAVLVLVTSGVPAYADHAPETFCSESGDVCASTEKVNGSRLLQISLAADYFDTYRLCVRAPDNTRECKKFDIEKSGSAYGDAVRWKKHFPDKGAGDYIVRWRSGGSAVTPRLGFHVM